MIGVVLAGGASTRMGRDKALIAVDGTPMALRVAQAMLAGGCERVVCQGGDAAALEAFGLTTVADPEPGAGPLAAIAAALADAGPQPVLVAACDLADLDATTVRTLLDAAGDHPHAAAVVAADASGPHLLGVWRADAAGPLGDLLARGVRSYRAAIDQLGAVRVPVPAAAIRNLNTPGDLERRG